MVMRGGEGGEGTVVSAVLPVGTALGPRSVGVLVGGCGTKVNLVLCAGQPHTSLYAQATGAHQPWFGWAPPIRALDHGSRWVVGPTRVEINLTFSPLISTFTFNF